MSVKDELALLTRRQFCPLFVTQFFGALNDNLFKNALIILLAFTKPHLLNKDTIINLCAALFILPYFLFSALAGQLADKYEKSQLIKYIKLMEVFLVILITFGFYYDSLVLLLSSLFLLGLQCTFFGPIKYSILPQHLQESELMGGNGLIGTGTFLAILLGTILGGFCIAIPETGIIWVSLVLVLAALIGFGASLFIPRANACDPELRLDWNLFRQGYQIVKETLEDKTLGYTIIGISWFWFYGSIFLSQMANYARIHLGGNEYVATLLLVSFSIGIGLGSILCDWLSDRKIDIGFVFLASLGLTLFSLDFALIEAPIHSPIFGVSSFILHAQNWRLLMDGLLIGFFGGLYIVPLYTLILKRSESGKRSRVIAAINILSAAGMVLSSGLAILVLNFGFSIPELFLGMALANSFLGLYLVKLKKLTRDLSRISISHAPRLSIES